MMDLWNVLATAGDEAISQAEKIDGMYELMTNIIGFKFMLGLMVITAILGIVIFQRQKKIAQNQVDLAKMMEQLLEKK